MCVPVSVIEIAHVIMFMCMLMCVDIYIYVHIHIHIYIYICVCMHLSLYPSIYLRIKREGERKRGSEAKEAQRHRCIPYTLKVSIHIHKLMHNIALYVHVNDTKR